MRHAAIVEVVAGHHREHGVIETEPIDRLGHPLGFVGGGCLRVAGVDQAEAARPGAALAEHHERRGAVGPALAEVRAAGVLAHRDEVELAQRLAEPQHVGAELDLRAEPVGLAGFDRQAVGDAGALEARVERGRNRTASPGPSPRENAARSSGR